MNLSSRLEKEVYALRKCITSLVGLLILSATFSDQGVPERELNLAEAIRRVCARPEPGLRVGSAGQAQVVGPTDAEGTGALREDEVVHEGCRCGD